jgi:hypothetical protein
VHPRIHKKHPEIEDQDVITAWTNAISMHKRTFDPPDYYAAAGFDNKSRILEMVAVESDEDEIIIFHAMRLTKKMRSELGM